jgi:hypothetical protein
MTTYLNNSKVYTLVWLPLYEARTEGSHAPVNGSRSSPPQGFEGLAASRVRADL